MAMVCTHMQAVYTRYVHACKREGESPKRHPLEKTVSQLRLELAELLLKLLDEKVFVLVLARALEVVNMGRDNEYETT